MPRRQEPNLREMVPEAPAHARAWPGPVETRGVVPPYMVADAPPHPLQRHLAEIERMSAQGMEPLQIARRLGISEMVFADAVGRFEDIAAALTGGRARMDDEMSAQLRRNALSGDTGAAQFLLRTRAGYTTTQHVTVAPAAPEGPRPAPITLDHVDAMAARQRALLGPSGG